MSGINKVMLVGHIGKVPELKNLTYDVPELSFPLATSELLSKHGQKEEHTEWHNVVMWRALAEAGYRALSKGQLIYVEGKIKTTSFKDKAGIRRYSTDIVAESFTIINHSSEFAGIYKEKAEVG